VSSRENVRVDAGNFVDSHGVVSIKNSGGAYRGDVKGLVKGFGWPGLGYSATLR